MSGDAHDREVVVADVAESITIDDDGTVVEQVETDVLETVLDEDGEPVEVVETQILDTAVIDPDGRSTEVVVTDVVDAVRSDDGVEVTEVIDVDVEETVVLDDDATDTRVEQIDDGSAAVAGAEAIVGTTDALPFEMPARERFAALDDIEATGDARVDAATARLDEVPDLPTTDHVGVYEDVHHRLQDALSDTEVR